MRFAILRDENILNPVENNHFLTMQITDVDNLQAYFAKKSVDDINECIITLLILHIVRLQGYILWILLCKFQKSINQLTARLSI